MFCLRFKRILYVLSGLMFLPSVVAQTIHTVPTDFATIEAAINAAIDGDFIIVKNGVYSGAGNVNLDPMGKALVIRSENGPGSCYIQCGKNSRAFVVQSGESKETVISGFTIRHGFSESFGGGILCSSASPLIENCYFENNSAVYGAAIASLNGNPQIHNCYFFSNRASMFGAGVFCANSSATISTATFSWNFAEAGGGIYACWFSQPSIVNCLINWNSADRGGGIASEFLAFPSIRNSTLANNSGWGVFSDWGNFSAINSIFNANTPAGFETGDMEPDVTFCCLQDSFPGTGNIDDVPMFALGPQGEYYLGLPESPGINPCVNAGNQPAADICWTIGSEIICMNEYTTDVEMLPDAGIVDLGSHFIADTDCQRLGVRFIGPESQPEEGDLVGLDIEICNPGEITHVELPLFIIMEQFGEYWFWPSWVNEADFMVIDVEPGKTTTIVMESEPWSGAGPEWFGSRFYSALTDSTITEIRGEIAVYPYRFEML